MRKLQLNLGLFCALTLTFVGQNIFSQEKKTTLEVDPKIEELLSLKKKMNTSLAIDEGYKIQICSGSAQDCEKNRNAFKRDFSEYDSTISYSSPNYKLYAGPFEKRIQAENALLKIKEKHPLALLIKP
ncbi:SPOR domain-containing protein [Flavobacterium sp.]|uniref:SPOR domain-containing protein n=1 Tax=Flavobacterium sp. TaxID=239 RepID=UPI003527B06A